jgi:hypothetical protein
MLRDVFRQRLVRRHELRPAGTFASQLVAILFERNFDELRAGTNLQFSEDLAERGFHRTFGDLQALADFPIRQALKDQTEDGLVALGELRPAGGAIAVDRAKEGAEIGIFETDLASGDLADGFEEHAEGVMLVKDSSNSRLHQLNSLLIADTGCNDEYLSFKTATAGGSDEIESSFGAEVDIE